MRSPPLLAAALLIASSALAQHDGPTTARAEYAALVAEYEAADSAARESRRAIMQSEEYQAARKSQDNARASELVAAAALDLPAWVARFRAAAERHRDSDGAVQFLCWIAINSDDHASVKEALDLLVADHLDSSSLLAVVETPYWTYRVVPADESIPILRQIADGSRFDIVRAYALYELARVSRRSKPDDAEAAAAADAMLAKAEKLAQGTDLQLLIQAPRFEQERLQIGMAAPDISGDDLDGVPFNLSDYRGKVVVLDFWGDW